MNGSILPATPLNKTELKLFAFSGLCQSLFVSVLFLFAVVGFLLLLFSLSFYEGIGQDLI